MKKILPVLISLVLFVTQGYSQEKINGVGPFKVGITTIFIIDSLKSLYGNELITDITQDAEESTPTKVAEVLLNENNLSMSPSYAPYVKGHRHFKLPTLNIASLVIEQMALDFYMDTLYEISISSPSQDLLNALKIKYGEPKLEVKTKPFKCLYNLTGNIVTQESKEYTSTYRKDKQVEAESTLFHDYDQHCKENFFSVIIIESVSKKWLDKKEVDEMLKATNKPKTDADLNKL